MIFDFCTLVYLFYVGHLITDKVLLAKAKERVRVRQGSSVGIVIRLRAARLKYLFSDPGRTTDFLLLQRFQTGSGAYTPSYVNTFTAIVDLSRFNNSCLKSPASTLVDLTFQSRARSALSA